MSRSSRDGRGMADDAVRGGPPGAERPEGPRPRVILVREWEQQLSSSGCCGRIEGDFLDFGEAGERPFSGRRDEMECAGDLYRAVKARYGDRVDVRIVDPRNLLGLLPTVLGDARRHGASLPEALWSLLRLSVNTVVVNGRIVARNRWPDPAELFRELEDVVEPRPDARPVSRGPTRRRG